MLHDATALRTVTGFLDKPYMGCFFASLVKRLATIGRSKPIIGAICWTEHPAAGLTFARP